jgi:transcriptional regulator with XRE-family HTH domain
LLLRFGKAVRRVREAQRISQEALADTAGIDRSHMGKIERGQMNVTLLNIGRIAKALSREPSDLMLEAEQPD